MRITERIAAGAVRVVHLGGLSWKIRRICTLDITRAGGRVLFATRPKTTRPTDDLPPPSVQALADTAKFADAVLIAGVLAVSEDNGVTWEECRLVAQEAQDAPAEGRLWVERLLEEHRLVLAANIKALSQDGADADAWLARFHARNAGNPGSGGESVRGGSGDGGELAAESARPGGGGDGGDPQSATGATPGSAGG